MWTSTMQWTTHNWAGNLNRVEITFCFPIQNIEISIHPFLWLPRFFTFLRSQNTKTSTLLHLGMKVALLKLNDIFNACIYLFSILCLNQFFLFVQLPRMWNANSLPYIHIHIQTSALFFLMQRSTSKSMSLFMVKQNRRFCLCSFSIALCAYEYVLYVAFFTVNVRALKMRVLIRFGMWNSKLWRVRSFIWWRYNRIITKQSEINNISFSYVFGKWLYMNEF